jgi:hypothetical protein
MNSRSLLLGFAGFLVLFPYVASSWQLARTSPHYYHLFSTPLSCMQTAASIRRSSASFSVSSISSYHDGDEDDNSDNDLCRRTLAAALVKMSVISQTDFSASRFNKRRMHRRVEVRESSIPGAGLGLFAREPIKSGTIISFYPVHALGMMDMGDGSLRRVSIDYASGKTQELPQHESDNDATTRPSTAEDNQAYIHHIMGQRLLMKTDIVKDLGGAAIFVDVDLNQQESPGFVGHRINDGATVLTNTEHGVLTYYQASRDVKNCIHVPFGPSPLLAVVTTKKVKKNEEFFTTYGVSYWLESLLKNKTEDIEETDMTDAIVLQARGVAMDVLKGMKDVAIGYANEADELQAIFDAP